MSRRILVTGARGFLGRYSVEALGADGWQVFGTGRRRPDLDGLVSSYAADLMNPPETEQLLAKAKSDTLLHLAWVNDPGRGMDAHENNDWVDASLNLARAFADAGGRRIVFGSSCAVYDLSLIHI